MSQRYFEDVAVGDELEPVERVPTDAIVTEFFRREGEPEPTPEQMPIVREGFGGLIVPGILKVSWLTQHISDWAGQAGRVRTIRVAYKRPDPSNEPLILSAKVVDKRQEDGKAIVELEVATVVADGPSMRGSVLVELPVRG